MKVHYDFENLNIKNPVVTTGTFDGVHIGHKAIINRLNKLADENNGESVLITFHPHPRKVLYPEGEGKDLKLINTQKEKIEMLGKTGLCHLIIIEFTVEFSKITSEEFLKDVLLKKLNADIIIVGFNHHFGYHRLGDYSYLYKLASKLGFKTEEIPEQELHHEKVSSTIIRKALNDGNIGRANAYLDHYYIVSGNVINGTDIFKNTGLGTSCIDIIEEEKLLPPSGIYAVSVDIGQERVKGITVIHEPGNKNKPVIEMSLLKSSSVEIAHEKSITLNFHKKINLFGKHQNFTDMCHLIEKGIKLVDELIY